MLDRLDLADQVAMAMDVPLSVVYDARPEAYRPARPFLLAQAGDTRAPLCRFLPRGDQERKVTP